MDIIRGVASDSAFPPPVSPEQDLLAVAWNNEFLSDPGMTSHTFYCNLLNTYMWAMSQGSAKALFASTAIVPVAIVTIIACTPKGASPLKAVLLDASINATIFLGYLVLGIASSVTCYFIGVNWRDLRTWYDWPFVRVAFLVLSAALPVLLIELWRKGCSCCCCGYGCSPDDTPGGTVTFLGVLLVYSVLLLVTALFLTDIGFTFFWFCLCAVVATGAEVLLGTLLTKRSAEYGAIPLSESGESEKQGLFVSLLVRDFITIFAPMMLAMTPWFDIVLVLSYIIDGMKLGFGNGALCGFLSIVFLLPLLPVAHRLTYSNMKVVGIVTASLWAALLLACIFVPTDTTKYCYLNVSCLKK